MKTKQAHIKAVFTTENTNAHQPSNKQLLTAYKIVDKKSEKVIVDCRTWIGTSKNASTVIACLWVEISSNKKPVNFEYGYLSGYGTAGGYGYCKESAAIQDAIDSAGIELYGSAYGIELYGSARYGNSNDKNDFKKRARVNGTGLDCAEKALLAIAYSAGYNDVICVRVDG